MKHNKLIYEYFEKDKGKKSFLLILSLLMLLYFSSFIIYFIGIVQNNRFDLFNDLLNSHIFWQIPFLISNILVLFFLKKIRSYSEFLLNKLGNYLYDCDYISNLLNKIYSYREQFIFCFPFMVIAMIFQINYLILNPWPWNLALFNELPLYASIMYSIGVLQTGISYFIIFLLIYFCTCTVIFIYKISKNFKKEISIEDLENLPLDEFGQLAFLLSCTPPLTLGWTFIAWFSPGLEPLNQWWVMFQTILFVLGSLIFFFFPLFFTHQAILEKKRKCLSPIKKEIWSWYSIIKDPKTKANELNTIKIRINNLEIFEKRILNVQTWPFENDFIGKLFFPLLIAISPILIQFIAIFFFNVNL